jgi:hypothetical protein
MSYFDCFLWLFRKLNCYIKLSRVLNVVGIKNLWSEQKKEKKKRKKGNYRARPCYVSLNVALFIELQIWLLGIQLDQLLREVSLF